METQDLSRYEIMLILHPELGEDQVKKEIQEIKDFAKETGGGVYFEDLWGLRDLRYMIKKQDKGIYVVLNFTADPLRVKEMEKHLNINQAVLRYLMLKISEHYKAKTIAEYDAAAAEEDKAKEEKQQAAQKEEEKRVSKPVRKEAPAPARKKEEKTEKKTEEVEEEKKVKKVKPAKTEAEEAEEAEEKEKKAKKSSKTTLEEVDQKLKSLIDDPDIKL